MMGARHKKLKTMDMYYKNNEFKRQLSTKFKDHDIYQEELEHIKNRPEIGPHYILNFESNYELGPGRETVAPNN